MTDPRGRKANHLAGETSPYLLQHLYNPVDWHPWGREALDRARSEDRPIFLSVGYAACHWCHVMERESFEDAEIADLLNRHFVPIKVDREERPDLDEVYMAAVQMLTGSGGWPLNVILTPELEPFFGGTYFPPRDGFGRPGLRNVLQQVQAAWSTRRESVLRSAGDLTAQIERMAAGLVENAGTSLPGPSEAARAVAELTGRFDTRRGGFSSAPKFPPDSSLALLLREHGRTGEPTPLRLVETTLDAMALGGIYDHVGGGFARYSVDDRWLVPHFEKMLYNQALLVPIYLEAWLAAPKPLYRRVVEQVLDFVGRELTDEEGAFHSSLDADSEGVEGKFYVWTTAEIADVLGPEDAELYGEIYDITSQGNFEGRSIPNLLGGSLAGRAAERGMDEESLVVRLEPSRRKLLAARERRPRPAKDDKVLTAWNGLMISAYARAHQVWGREEDLSAARRAAAFVTDQLLRDDRLLVTHRAGQSKLNAYLDEYAFFARGLLDLYEACFETHYLETAGRLARTLVARFEDADRGGFFFTSDDHEKLLTRSRSLHDGALPAGAGVAVELLARLSVHLEEPALLEPAQRALAAALPAIRRMPSAFASLLLGAELVESPPLEIAIVGSPDEPVVRKMLEAVRSSRLFRPAVQVGPADAPGAPLLAGKRALEARPTAYVCRERVCREPTTDPAELADLLDE